MQRYFLSNEILSFSCIQFKLAIESKNQRFCLPYKMNEKAKGVITDSNGYQFSIRYFHSEKLKHH